MRAILTQDLDNRPSRQVTTQRAMAANADKKLNICMIRGTPLDSGPLDVEKILLTDEQMRMLGSFGGRYPNFAAYVKNGAKRPTP